MKKKTKKTEAPRQKSTARPLVQDWTKLFTAFQDVSDWALDIATRLAREYPEELAAIENVRAFVHAWLAGRRSEIPVRDLLTAIAIVFSAIELDLGIDSVSLLGPMRTMLDTPSTLPAMLHLPGVRQDGHPTVVIRRFPCRRAVA